MFRSMPSFADPHPWAWEDGCRLGKSNCLHRHNEKGTYSPRPEFGPASNNPGNPILIAYREQIQRHPLTVDAESWLAAFAALDAFGGYSVWEHPSNVFNSLVDADPEHVDHARQVIERLATIGRAA